MEKSKTQLRVTRFGIELGPMDHRDHVNLLRGGVISGGEVWGDFGSGDGAFTLALRDLIGPAADLWSIDKDRSRLERQRELFRSRFPGSNVHFLNADFAHPVEVPPLDGIVMANSLHFFRIKDQVLRLMWGYLKEGGRLVVVEYNEDSGNPWVPHPIGFENLRGLALKSGFSDPQLLARVPSRFLREIYSAVALKPKGPQP